MGVPCGAGCGTGALGWVPRAGPARAFLIKGQRVKLLGFLPTAWGGTEAAALSTGGVQGLGRGTSLCRRHSPRPPSRQSGARGLC